MKPLFSTRGLRLQTSLTLALCLLLLGIGYTGAVNHCWYVKQAAGFLFIPTLIWFMALRAYTASRRCPHCGERFHGFFALRPRQRCANCDQLDGVTD